MEVFLDFYPVFLYSGSVAIKAKLSKLIMDDKAGPVSKSEPIVLEMQDVKITEKKPFAPCHIDGCKLDHSEQVAKFNPNETYSPKYIKFDSTSLANHADMYAYKSGDAIVYEYGGWTTTTAWSSNEKQKLIELAQQEVEKVNKMAQQVNDMKVKINFKVDDGASNVLIDEVDKYYSTMVKKKPSPLMSKKPMKKPSKKISGLTYQPDPAAYKNQALTDLAWMKRQSDERIKSWRNQIKQAHQQIIVDTEQIRLVEEAIKTIEAGEFDCQGRNYSELLNNKFRDGTEAVPEF